MSRAVMQQALEALEAEVSESWECKSYHPKIQPAITALRAALAEPEQGPISLNGGRLTQYPDGRIGFGTLESVGAIGHAPTPRKPQTTHWEGCEAVHPECRKPEQEPKQVAWNWMLDGLPHGPAYYGPPPDDHVAQIGLANGRSVRLLYTAPPQREHITDGSPCWCNPDVFEEDGGNVIVHNYEDNWQQYAKPGETAQQCIERHRAEQDALMKLYATPRKPVELTDEQIVQVLGDVRESITGNVFLAFARAIIAAYEAKNGITGEQT